MPSQDQPPRRSKYIKGPFRADFRGGYVFSADGLMFADVRGWGELQKERDGDKLQDEHLQYMVDSLNEKWERENRCRCTWKAGVLQPPEEMMHIPDGARCTLAPHGADVEHHFEKVRRG